jgi:hypothetical protein
LTKPNLTLLNCRWAEGADGSSLFVFDTEQRFSVFPAQDGISVDAAIFEAVDWNQPRLVFAAVPEAVVSKTVDIVRAHCSSRDPPEVHWHDVWVADLNEQIVLSDVRPELQIVRGSRVP